MYKRSSQRSLDSSFSLEFPNRPVEVDLSALNPEQALDTAKELSLRLAAKVLKHDIRWKSAFLYSQNRED